MVTGWNLHHAGMLGNALFVTDQRKLLPACCAAAQPEDLPEANFFRCCPAGDTCNALIHEQIPCWLDTEVPSMQAVLERQHRIFEFQKWYWALQFGLAGFSTLFLDVDVIVLRSPWHTLDRTYDLQGLSEWLPGVVISGSKYGSLNRHFHPEAGCGVDYGELASCQCTAIWLAQPTERTLTLMADLVMLLQTQGGWEQNIFNRVRCCF